MALANEKIVVFHRNSGREIIDWRIIEEINCFVFEDGTWNLNNLYLIITGKSRESVRCMIDVGSSVWCGVANRIYVIDALTVEVRVCSVVDR